MPTETCRHIKTNGLRCGSPALRAEVFCYFHKGLRSRHRRPSPTHDASPATIHPMRADDRGHQLEPVLAQQPAPQPETLELPPLEDRDAIQVAISMIVTTLAANRIDPKRASMLLYGLQVASSNCGRLDPSTSRHDIIRDTVLDPAGQCIAPDQEPQSRINFNAFLKSLEEGHDEDCDCEDCSE